MNYQHVIAMLPFNQGRAAILLPSNLEQLLGQLRLSHMVGISWNIATVPSYLTLLLISRAWRVPGLC